MHYYTINNDILFDQIICDFFGKSGHPTVHLFNTKAGSRIALVSACTTSRENSAESLIVRYFQVCLGDSQKRTAENEHVQPHVKVAVFYHLM